MLRALGPRDLSRLCHGEQHKPTLTNSRNAGKGEKMESARFCGQCGVRNAATENFCSACGSPLQKAQGIAVTEPPVQAVDQQSHVENDNVSAAAPKPSGIPGVLAETPTTPKGILANGVVFVLVYLILAVPTYVLPYFGSNSSILNVLGAATGLGALPQFWFHLIALYLLIVVAWIRGGLIGKQWISIFPAFAAIFDMVPGFSAIPLLPTIFHVLAVVMGVNGKLVAIYDAAAGKRRLIVSAVGLAAIATLTVVKTQTFFLNAKQGPAWEKHSAQQNPPRKNMTRTPVITAVGDKATERIGSGESRDNWTLDKTGTITFEHQAVAKAGDPLAAELRISKGSQNGALRYAILVDADTGPMEGFVWRKDAKSVLARISARGISDTVFWSPDGAYAIVTDAGEVQDHVYVVNLKDGRVTKQQVGAPFKVGDCEIKYLYGQPASWVGNSSFQVAVKIEKNGEESNCSNVKPRSMNVEVPLN